MDSNDATSTHDTSRSVSPCSAVAPHPPPRLSVTDLTSQLAGQRLQQNSLICYDSCEAYANTDDDSGWEIDVEPFENNSTFLSSRRSRTISQRPTRPHSPSQRLQRQVNARMLCSSTHQRDMAVLVSRMVESNDQCSVSAPEHLPSAMCNEEDEGYDSGEGSTPIPSRRPSLISARPTLNFRRSSDMRTTGACVSKNARVRKDRSQHVRMRSWEKAQ